MAYNVVSGEIIANVLYYVAGGQSAVYNGVTYNTGDYFRGVKSVKTFTYSGVGSAEINEVAELNNLSIELEGISTDLPARFSETLTLKGFGIEYELNESEKKVNEITKILGFGLELVDYPFYSFEITEIRL